MFLCFGDSTVLFLPMTGLTFDWQPLAHFFQPQIMHIGSPFKMATLELNSALLRRFSSFIQCRKRFLHLSTCHQQSLVTKDVEGPVSVIGINRPMKKNCVNKQVADELREEFRRFEANPDEKVAVLHGHGGTFCSGYDLAEVQNLKPEQMNEFMQMEDGPMGPTRMRLSKPVIAAIEGYAVAGGLELAVMCDLRVADESAIFGVFCRRYGVPLIDGGTIRLPHLVGLSRAMDLILTGREVKAEEALKIGLINHLVSRGTTLDEAIKLGHQLSELPQVCMNTDRLSVYNAIFSAGKSLEELFSDEARFGMEALNDLMQEGRRNPLGKYNKP